MSRTFWLNFCMVFSPDNPTSEETTKIYLLGQGCVLQRRVCKYSRRFILIMRIWRPSPHVLVHEVNPVSSNLATKI